MGRSREGTERLDGHAKPNPKIQTSPTGRDPLNPKLEATPGLCPPPPSIFFPDEPELLVTGYADVDVLQNGPNMGALTLDGFEQFDIDMRDNERFAEALDGQPIAPAPPEIIDVLAQMTAVESPGELLTCLKQFCDVGFKLPAAGSTYQILPGEVILQGQGAAVCAPRPHTSVVSTAAVPHSGRQFATALAGVPHRRGNQS